jgi:regulator of nucleoside diphosphate kinase
MGQTHVTDVDFERLSALSRAMRTSPRPERAAVLEGRLKTASILPSESLGSKTVKMGSAITILDKDRNETFSYNLVFPVEADITRGRISVLTPLGASLLGRKEGEDFSYESPGGLVNVEVLEVIHDL